MLNSIRPFWRCFAGSWLLFTILFPLVSVLKLYEYIPVISFLGYAAIILLNLIAISQSRFRIDYILVSISLILIGLIASTDIIINKHEMITIWTNTWPSLTEALAEDYVQVLIILLNIFTGSIAAQSLFYGLNKREFDK